MPKFPKHSTRVEQITGSVFEQFRSKMVAQGDNLIKLHIGDTYLHPKYALPIEPTAQSNYENFHQYCDTFGIEPLRAVLAEKLREDNKLNVTVDNILITCGATNALSVSMMALVQPGDEVLILTPAWPFFFGMVKIAGGKIIEAQFYTKLFEQPDLDIGSYLDKFITPNTTALYLNTPNNPSGKVLTRGQLEQVAELAEKHNLWVISDEAYDGLTFDERPHLSIASFPRMFERTITIHTFSKSFMFAGLRLGYAVGTPDVITSLNKMMVHQLYSPATLAQYMMIEPVRRRHNWLPEVRRQYQDLRDVFVRDLKLDFPQPEGTYFIFFSADGYLNGRSYFELIDGCLDAGVSVAPGDSFGMDFQNYIRLCFTGEPPERLKTGIERLNKIFKT